MLLEGTMSTFDEYCLKAQDLRTAFEQEDLETVKELASELLKISGVSNELVTEEG